MKFCKLVLVSLVLVLNHPTFAETVDHFKGVFQFGVSTRYWSELNTDIKLEIPKQSNVTQCGLFSEPQKQLITVRTQDERFNLYKAVSVPAHAPGMYTLVDTLSTPYKLELTFDSGGESFLFRQWGIGPKNKEADRYTKLILSIECHFSKRP